MSDRIAVRRFVPAPATAVFAVLTDPAGHVAIDSSGMLMSADGDVVTAVGDRFVVHMDREALNDLPIGAYDVTVIITGLEPDRAIEWTISGRIQPPLEHRYGYTLEPADGGTTVTSYYDWSRITDEWRAREVFPVIPESALRATLGILDRTVRGRLADTAP